VQPLGFLCFASSSGGFGLCGLARAPKAAELDAGDRIRLEVSPGGAADLAGCDRRDPLGPALGVVEVQPPPLELQQPVGPRFDALEVECPGACQVTVGTVNLVVGIPALVHGPDLFRDGDDHSPGVLGRRGGVDSE